MRLSALHKTMLVVVWLNATDGMVNSILPPFLQDLGYSMSIIGFIVSVFGILSLSSRLPAGLIYRPWRVKQILRVFLALLAISVLLYPTVSDALVLSALRGAQGLSFGIASTLNLALLMDALASDRNRARAMAVYSALSSAGYSIGNFSSGLLVDNLGYATAFRALGLFAILAPFLAVEIPRNLVGEQANPAPSAGGSRFATLRSKLTYVTSPGLMIISLMAFSLYFLYSAYFTFFPLYALGVGLTLSSVGFLRGLNAIFGTITRPFSGEATRLAGYDLVSGIGLVASAALIALTPSFDSIIAFVPLLVMLGLTRGMASVSNTVGLAEEVGADAEKRGVASGVFNTAKDLGVFAGPLFGGIVASQMGIDGMMRVIPAAILGLYFVPVIVGRVTGVIKPRGRPARGREPV